MDVRYKGLYNGLPERGDRIVYVRPMAVADLPEALRAQVAETGVDSGAVIYSVHSPDGHRIALVGDCNMAFALARHNDLAAVYAH